MKNLIGIHGKARSGKDTLANLIVGDGLEWIRYGFADPIKLACNQLFGWDERHSFGELKEVVDPFWGFSPREAYQKFGTEFGRNLLRDDIWLKVAEKQLSDTSVVIADVRFANEAEWVLAQGGVLVHIIRPGLEEIKLSSHSSEAGLPKAILSEALVLENNAGVDKLEIFSRILLKSFDNTEFLLDKTLYHPV